MSLQKQLLSAKMGAKKGAAAWLRLFKSLQLS